MERKNLESLFSWKIGSELTLYKSMMLKKEKEDMIANAYEIANIIEFYEILVELCQKMSDEQIYQCMQISNLLATLYDRWMKIPDESYEEKEHTVWSVLENRSIHVV